MFSLPWTEFLTESGGSGTGFIDDTPLSGPVDLPEEVDLPDFAQFDDDLQVRHKPLYLCSLMS